MKYALLLSTVVLAGCSKNTFTAEQINAIQNACTSNGGVITSTHTDMSGTPYSTQCRAAK